LVVFTSALGIFLAPESISLSLALTSMLATSGLVAGACMINCVMEKDIDAHMERTRHRPLPAGRIKPHSATFLGLSLLHYAVAILIL
jgi:heme o synthase